MRSDCTNRLSVRRKTPMTTINQCGWHKRNQQLDTKHEHPIHENERSGNQRSESARRFETAPRSMPLFAVIASLLVLVLSAPRSFAVGALDTSFGNGGTQVTPLYGHDRKR